MSTHSIPFIIKKISRNICFFYYLKKFLGTKNERIRHDKWAIFVQVIEGLMQLQLRFHFMCVV